MDVSDQLLQVPRDQDTFTTEEALRYTGATMHQQRYWDKLGLVKPSVQETGGRPGRRRKYSLEDLVELRVIVQTLATGVPLQSLRAASERWRENSDLLAEVAERRLNLRRALDLENEVIELGEDATLAHA